MVRIAFVTDIHLKIGDLSYGVNTQENFHLVLDQIKSWSLDHLILGGDLSARAPDKLDCEYVAKEVNKSGISFSIVSVIMTTALTLLMHLIFLSMSIKRPMNYIMKS